MSVFIHISNLTGVTTDCSSAFYLSVVHEVIQFPTVVHYSHVSMCFEVHPKSLRETTKLVRNVNAPSMVLRDFRNATK